MKMTRGSLEVSLAKACTHMYMLDNRWWPSPYNHLTCFQSMLCSGVGGWGRRGFKGL